MVQKNNEKVVNYMNNKQYPIMLVKEWDKYLVGQNAYKETIAMGIYRHIFKNTTAPIMVVGPTGSGKTYLFQLLKNSKLCPEKYTIMITNISRLTEEGVKGQDLDDVFIQFKQLCQSEHNPECRGLIYIDEIDKIIYPSYVSSGNGDINRNSIIQHQLMQILDGGTIAGISTKNILFVFGGAFHQLDDLKKKGGKHNPIGFTSSSEKNIQDILSDDTFRNKLLEIGFQREFLGRISQIVQLQALNEIELKAILLHPTKGVISQMKNEYASDGIELIVNDDAIDGIVKSVVRENLGARSVKNIVEKILNGAWYHCIAYDYNQIIIDHNVIEGGAVHYKKKCVSQKIN